MQRIRNGDIPFGGQSMTAFAQTGSKNTPEIPLAVLLDGVSQKWGMNVLQILGRRLPPKWKSMGMGRSRLLPFS